ncbi:aldehyde dehydrogenase family protein [Cryptosporangium phraense]|uniref:Aldehyde dehydrogenase family protein n=1 Tax=Cryptosporangium phraense TaxID=2593070 RepID=A0A545AQ43_9ACTN|nr:aldehyde dehydrogenase family protein [Cryptosporangium phraense]TQS43449.1 aldehyde dehydrogenase family protein [Cryptosporangium phraense]
MEDFSGLPIGAGWRPAATTSPVLFPFDGSPVGEAPVGDLDAARAALDAAADVAPAVAALPTRIRHDVLLGVHARLTAFRDEFERLLVLETGKPLKDCRTEVSRTLLTLVTSAEEAARIHGETVPLDGLPAGDGMVGFYLRVPIGVVVGIAGFNYPLLLATHKIGPALAAGCPIIVKPAPQTPLATLRLVQLLREVGAEHGVPAAAVQLVTGGADVGAALTTDPRVAAVSFTGSALVGHRIARAVAPRKTLLELGNTTALIVAEDADLPAAAAAVARGGFYASGQACISVQRVLVVESVRDRFLELLTPQVEALVVGDPREPDTDVAPLIDPAATERVASWVDAAVAAGASVLTGDGTRPTVLADVPDDVDAWDEEIFGPVVCVRSVPDVDTAIQAANRSRYGLHASIWTRSLAHAFAALHRLEVGGVVVNDLPGFRSDPMPYGGVKDSGIGREGPRYAIEELTVTRMAVIRP